MLRSYFYQFLQEEYVQKTNVASGPLSFTDKQKEEVHILFVVLLCY